MSKVRTFRPVKRTFRPLGLKGPERPGPEVSGPECPPSHISKADPRPFLSLLRPCWSNLWFSWHRSAIFI